MLHIAISFPRHPLPRAHGEVAGRVSCRVDEHFSHFFFIFTRIVFKKGFIIIALVHPIMLACDNSIIISTAFFTLATTRYMKTT